VFDAPNNVDYQGQSDFITLSWEAPDIGGGATSVARYLVSWNSSFSNPDDDEVEQTSTQISNLETNTRYTIAVSAISTRNDVGFAATVQASTCKLLFKLLET